MHKTQTEKPNLRTPKATETKERLNKKVGDISNRARMGSIELHSEKPSIQEPSTGANVISNKSLEQKIKKIPSHVKHQSEQLLGFTGEVERAKKDLQMEKLIVFRAESIDDEILE